MPLIFLQIKGSRIKMGSKAKTYSNLDSWNCWLWDNKYSDNLYWEAFSNFTFTYFKWDQMILNFSLFKAHTLKLFLRVLLNNGMGILGKINGKRWKSKWLENIKEQKNEKGTSKRWNRIKERQDRRCTVGRDSKE